MSGKWGPEKWDYELYASFGQDWEEDLPISKRHKAIECMGHLYGLLNLLFGTGHF